MVDGAASLGELVVGMADGLRVRGGVALFGAYRKDNGNAEAGGLVVERPVADVRDLGLRGHKKQADQVASRRRRRLLLPFSRVAPRHVKLAAYLKFGHNLVRLLVRVG